MSGIAIVVPAAGSGSRMGGAPKQFRNLGGKPVLVQTLLALMRDDRVREVVVAAPTGDVGAVREILSRFEGTRDVQVVAGGATRQASVLAASAASTPAVEAVLVHDAVRPFISRNLLTRVIDRTLERGAAAVAIPVSDTLRRVEGDTFGETVMREQLYRMQTPQGARRDILMAALRGAVQAGIAATDEVEALRFAGAAVSLVEGDPRNVKLTHAADWALAEAWWRLWEEEQAS